MKASFNLKISLIKYACAAYASFYLTAHTVRAMYIKRVYTCFFLSACRSCNRLVVPRTLY